MLEPQTLPDGFLVLKDCASPLVLLILLYSSRVVQAAQNILCGCLRNSWRLRLLELEEGLVSVDALLQEAEGKDHVEPENAGEELLVFFEVLQVGVEYVQQEVEVGVGFALEDYSALTWVAETAIELGLGELIELVPRSADPKDLFGALRLPQPQPATV